METDASNKSPISDRCATQLEQEKVLEQGTFILIWVTMREYKRANETAADVQAWDDLCKNAWAKQLADPKYDAKEEVAKLINEKAKSYGQAMTMFLISSPTLPGWNDTTCRMNWHEYACFANWAAKQTKADLLTYGPGNPPQYKCDPSIKSDPTYDGELPMPGQSQAKGFFSGWVPWAIGGAAVIAVTGAVLVATGKIGKPNPSNVDRKRKLYVGRLRVDEDGRDERGHFWGDISDEKIYWVQSGDMNIDEYVTASSSQDALDFIVKKFPYYAQNPAMGPRSGPWGGRPSHLGDTWLESERDGRRRARVRFPDGSLRIVDCSGVADTYFSIEAKARISGQKIDGYVTSDNDEYVFRPMNTDKAKLEKLLAK